MKLGLIGYGYWGKILLQNLPSNCCIEEVFIVDESSKQNTGIDSQQILKLKKIKTTFVTLTELLSKKIAAAMIATPEDTHAQVAALCLKKSISCFVEKPLATRSTDYLKLMHLAKNNNCSITVDEVFWYDEHFQFFLTKVFENFVESPTNIITIRSAVMQREKTVGVVTDIWPHDLYLFRLAFGKHPRTSSVILSVQKTRSATPKRHTIASTVTISGELENCDNKYTAASKYLYSHQWNDSKIALHTLLSWDGNEKHRELICLDSVSKKSLNWVTSGQENESYISVWENNKMTRKQYLLPQKTSPVSAMLGQWLKKLIDQPSLNQEDIFVDGKILCGITSLAQYKNTKL